MMDDLRFQDFAFDATPAHYQSEQRTIEAIRLIVVDAASGTIHPIVGTGLVSMATLC
jgi:hypothetical protein